jgi:hypothetical protein
VIRLRYAQIARTASHRTVRDFIWARLCLTDTLDADSVLVQPTAPNGFQRVGSSALLRADHFLACLQVDQVIAVQLNMTGMPHELPCHGHVAKYYVEHPG